MFVNMYVYMHIHSHFPLLPLFWWGRKDLIVCKGIRQTKDKGSPNQTSKVMVGSCLVNLVIFFLARFVSFTEPLYPHVPRVNDELQYVLYPSCNVSKRDYCKNWYGRGMVSHQITVCFHELL